MLLPKLILAVSLAAGAVAPKKATAPAASAASTSAGTPEEALAAQVAEIKARGDAAMVSGRPADALKEYEAAIALKPDPALVYNRARALQALERYPEALKSLEQFSREAKPELKAKVNKLNDLISEIRNKTSALALSSNVTGAEVLVAGKVIGKTPLPAKIEMNAGNYEVIVRSQDHHEYKKQIELPPAGVATVEAVLSLKNTTGLLAVTSAVVGANVSIDNEPRGTLPFEDYLPFGTHSVDVTAEGFVTAQNSVVIGTEARTVNVELSPVPKLYQRWYFWTVIGVAVAGGVAAGVAATTEKEPKAGSLGISSVGLQGVNF